MRFEHQENVKQCSKTREWDDAKRRRERPDTTHSKHLSVPMHRLQQTHGNRTVERLLRGDSGRIATPGGRDAQEREADRVATAVARTPVPPTRESSDHAPTTDGWHSKPGTGGTLLPNGSGRSLPANVQSFFEARFSADFGGVRIHTGRTADAATRLVGARVFTVGRDIVFSRGAYRSRSRAGRELLGHELTHVLQQAAGAGPRVQRRSYASRVEERLGFFNSREDAVAALDFLAGLSERDFDDTVADLASTGRVTPFVHKLGTRDQVRRFVRLLADRGQRSTQKAVFRATLMLNLDIESQLVVFGRPHAANLGVRGPSAPGGLRTRLVSSDPSDPFTGTAVRGQQPTDAPMTAGEFAAFSAQYLYARAAGKDIDRAKYKRIPGLEMIYDWSNPIKGGLLSAGYLGTLTARERREQAQFLFGQDIATEFPAAYGGTLPTRIQAIRAAAAAHNLSPELVAAFILAEQRDQSLREDAVDLRSAQLTGRSSSIGLGQVTVATAARGNVFADLLSPTMQRNLRANPALARSVATRLLTSDEFNIFAVATVIRNVANIGATKALASLPNTRREYGAINLSLFVRNSRHWTPQHIKLLGSEYTSAPFDDHLSTGWGEFVYEAYRDIQQAGLF